MTKFELIGSVPVDSGQVCIVDPCYLPIPSASDGYVSSAMANFKYEDFCEATLSDEGYGQVDCVVVTQSGWGDGVYPVFVTKNSAGRVSSMTIVFDADGLDFIDVGDV